MSLTVFTSKIQQFSVPGKFADNKFTNNPIILEYHAGLDWYHTLNTIEGMEIRFHSVTKSSANRIAKAVADRVQTLEVLLKPLPFNDSNARAKNVDIPCYLKVVTPHHYDSLSMLIKALLQNPKRGAEIGVFEGECGQYLLKIFPELYLYGIDPWASYNEYEKDNMNRADEDLWNKRKQMSTHAYNTYGPNRHQILQCKSTEADLEELDFVFIDANHTYDFVLADLNYWYPRVRSGGVISGHDYQWSDPIDPHGVKRAVLQFMKDNDIMRTVFITDHFAWAFVK